MKRLMLAVLIVSGLGTFGTASADCASASTYDQVYVKIGNVEIQGHQYGNFATGYGYACTGDEENLASLGSTDAGVTRARTGGFTISVDGTVVCSRTDQTVTADPFGFGIGIHTDTQTPDNPTGSPRGSCGANISLGNLAWASAKPETVDGFYEGPYTPADPATGTFSGVFFSPAEGYYYLSAATSSNVALQPGQVGWYTRGVRVEGVAAEIPH